jgi:hypothetical protein
MCARKMPADLILFIYALNWKCICSYVVWIFIAKDERTTRQF